jgi:hypothetical protein
MHVEPPDSFQLCIEHWIARHREAGTKVRTSARDEEGKKIRAMVFFGWQIETGILHTHSFKRQF